MISVPEQQATVLIIDDQKTQRQKLTLATTSLGCIAESAESGECALKILGSRKIDVILLDIVMPGMSGFDVLKILKTDSSLQHIPVIVISALEDEKDKVVTAIKMGAEDFLPKNFSAPLFQARINAGLQKKFYRDQELDQLEQLNRLMNATELLEQGIYNPSKMLLQDIGARRDSLGNFARIFTGMAQQIYDRDRRLNQQLNTIRGLGPLLLAGVLFGLDAPLAKIVSEFNAHPLGLSIWISLIVCCITLPYSISKRDIPKPTASLIRYFFVLGFLRLCTG